MRILLSAYGCSPAQGSEPGVGWAWATAGAIDHSVTVVTHPFFRSAIEKSGERAGLNFVYFEPWGFRKRRNPGELNSRLYYVYWQFCLYWFAKRHINLSSFDLVHHVTWGTYRLPVFIGALGPLTVLGPVGGGEAGAMALLSELPWKHRLKEWFRLLWIGASRFDLLLRRCLLSFDLILCRTDETGERIPRAYAVEICPDVGSIRRPRRARAWSGKRRILFAGRLIPCKGVDMAIDAIGCLVRRGFDAELIIAGDGPLRSFLEGRASADPNLKGIVKFCGHLSKELLEAEYSAAHVFLFPSSHDSGGTVVVEALAHGLPVVCLDLGGPRYFVDDKCGCVIRSADGRSAVIEGIVAAVEKITQTEAAWEAYSLAAHQKAGALDWVESVRSTYARISRMVRDDA